MDSEADEIKKLEKKVKELEATLKREQLKADFLNKMLDIGSQQAGIELKKIFQPPSSNAEDQTKH